MPIFPQVIARLREDDRILGMEDFEYLEVYFAFDGWPETIRDLLPDRWLPYVASISSGGSTRTPPGWRIARMFRTCRSPNGRYGLKADDDLTVAFHDQRPAWYWERKKGVWNLNALWAIRSFGGGSFVEVGQDIAHHWIGEDPPAVPPDAEDLECLDPRDAEIHVSNNPTRLLPDPLLGVLSHYSRVLKEGHARLEGTPYLPVPGNPNSACRYRSNDEFVVAYWPVENGEYEPAWCWKRKPDGAWKLYMLLSHPTKEIHDDYAPRELGVGIWG